MIEIPNFTVERELGRGGMATVYLAVQDMLSRNVALKVMLPDMVRDENFRKSFLSEGKIIANLEHPNIVRIHDFGIIDDSILYMAMEYLSEGTLKEKVAQGKVAYETAVKILEDTSAGLAYAHNKGYIHRDIKPGNILFRDDGTAVITDFGIAKLQDTSGELTRMGYTMGTVQYMSPEQAVTTDLDHRSDIYSLGLVFYEMLTGQKAFKAESTIQAIHQHTTVAPPELPPEYNFLQATIDKVLAKEPDDRFQNINDFVDAVKSAREFDETILHRIPPLLDDDSTQILKTGHYQVNRKPEKSKNKGLFVGLATSLTLIGGLAFGVTKYPEISSWLNKEDVNNQGEEQQATISIDQDDKKRALEKLKNIAETKALAEKREEQKENIERENKQKIAAAELQELEAEKIERDRVLVEKIAIAKRQAEDDKKSAESQKQRENAEAELKKLRAEKLEKDKALAIQIASAKKQAEDDRINAEAQLNKIEAEKKKRREILAEQIAKAKKQAEEAKKARALLEQQRIAAEKTKREQQALLLKAQLAEAQKKTEQERLAKLAEEKQEQEKQEQEKLKVEQAEIAKSKKLKAQKDQKRLDFELAEKNKLSAEQLKKDQSKAEQDRLDAEIVAQRKEKEAKLEKNRIAEQKRNDKANQVKMAKLVLSKKKVRDAQRKKDLAKKKIAQQKKRKAALIAKKKAAAIRKQQQWAKSKGQIRVSATLNGRPLKTTFVVTKNGKRVNIVGGRASANFVLPAGRYVVTTNFSGKVSRAKVHLEPNDVITQSFAFRASAPVQQPYPAQKNWTHEHKAE